MAKLDPAIRAHLEWIGFIRPTGLVVSAPALVRAGAFLNMRAVEGQRRLRRCMEERALSPDESLVPYLPDFVSFARNVLDWSFSPKGFAGTDRALIPRELEFNLPDFGETLRPDFAVRELNPGDDRSPWQLLVMVLDPGQDPDKVVRRNRSTLEASGHSRMERLLRHTQVPAGIVFNGRTLRLLSAPRGESSGWMDFRVDEMVQTAGRPICTAMRLLLGQDRLLTLPPEQRLATLLDASRQFQNEVSEKLAQQVLHALYEILRGLQSAHDASGGDLLREVLSKHPDEVYRALLNVTLRLVFLLYAEERDMLPKDDTFLRYYSLVGLHDRLREDAALHPDTMGQRFGAWPQLLVLFRMIHDGTEAGGIHLPRRHGVLFDPDRFPFLEGRAATAARQDGERITPPLIPDGTIYRALEKLLVLDGERISYRALDVEQIGSVYETMMGFRLEIASGRSIAIKAQKRQGAPTAIDLDALLAVTPADRTKWIENESGRKVPPSVSKAVGTAETLADLHAALRTIIDRAATPDLISRGAMVLHPSEERRRSGSHYTPRELTEPIVRTALEPTLARLRRKCGGPPRPEEILDLKVCDPAMGSGAFLVEACRQLGDALRESWLAHDALPPLPPDEDEVVFARRLVAQRCIYGVDRNPTAVDLAKVSLWLVTLARDHAFTFLDHALRHGDSLVGLSRAQIEAFHWKTKAPRFEPGFEMMRIGDHMAQVRRLRQQIRNAQEGTSDVELRELWDEADHELDRVRLFGDLTIAAFFGGAMATTREQKRAAYADDVVSGQAEGYRSWLQELRHADPPLASFHWDLEFPEVFDRADPGFEAFVGNPPFAGHASAVSANLPGYTQWLRTIHPHSTGKCDLVAHFFRRTFDLLREGGTLGLIATNTISQGDTRSTGLRWICNHGGSIYSACRRIKWPGEAAVVVSVIHISKGPCPGPRRLDSREVETISAFLFHEGGHDDPERLVANNGKSFIGSYILGMGFTFNDADNKGVATPLSELRQLIQANSHNREIIFPYIGGAEVNTSPTHSHHRYVINFGLRGEKECRQEWPELMAIVEEKVRPRREESARKSKSSHGARASVWWQHYHSARDLYAAAAALERVLVINCGATPHHAFAFLPAGMVFAHTLAVFPLETHAAFATLQSRPHEIWARFFSSSMKDDLRYTPSDCFTTFPFPEDWEAHPIVEAVGKEYYDSRAGLMVGNNEGMTKTYNRFHDPGERDAEIQKLRELHAAMDRAVLDTYGWTDIPTECRFLLDYEIDEENWNARKKKPWRFRWPNEIHDEVLARLLELNARRAKEEALAGGTTATAATVAKVPTKGRGIRVSTSNRNLFE